MNILISNDDGIEAKGIRALVNALKDAADITVVAPLYEKSGSGGSLTVHQPLKIKEVVRNGEFLGYGVNGTPADCVKLGLSKICRVKPDLVISGINRGPNNACNIYYSGTVGAAAEGAVNGILSIAVSMTDYSYDEYDASADFMRKFIDRVPDLPENCLLYNINIPNCVTGGFKGVRYTKMSLLSYLDNYDEGIDPFGEKYYWLSDFRKPRNPDDMTDDAALQAGYVSVTPLAVDRTDYSSLEKLAGMGDIL